MPDMRDSREKLFVLAQKWTKGPSDEFCLLLKGQIAASNYFSFRHRDVQFAVIAVERRFDSDYLVALVGQCPRIAAGRGLETFSFEVVGFSELARQ